ncbi:monovalent cation/H(+) antiporter subunit G [Tianweitania sediminis]|uniref:Monovalent cation/H(+) antiporter subunit G n=1 Tax=Tianweitania sediminis TaxID=1502156 RepID=A0A8J7RKF6_9HYPH|nr:monovalent cation/H(+) antiporter subunit G [Tianweitania sediminis]MBP0438876.1 monovalent cation/H(+) antiporter subunit G [Tianweitania sediminis]
MVATALELLAAVLLVVGSLFTLTAAIGILRLPDVYSRMHAASKAGTVGSCVILIAVALVEMDAALGTRAIAAAVFFLITAPISAHLLARAALQAGYPMWRGANCDERPQLARENDGTRD